MFNELRGIMVFMAPIDEGSQRVFVPMEASNLDLGGVVSSPLSYYESPLFIGCGLFALMMIVFVGYLLCRKNRDKNK